MPRTVIPTDIVKAEERTETVFKDEEVTVEIWSFRYSRGLIDRLFTGSKEYFERQVVAKPNGDWTARVSTKYRAKEISADEQVEETLDKLEEHGRDLDRWAEAVL